jgi:hypothetical protein
VTVSDPEHRAAALFSSTEQGRSAAERTRTSTGVKPTGT